MSIATSELAHASTEDIIRTIQQDMITVVGRAGNNSSVGLERFFAGDNPTVEIERQADGVTVRIDSLPSTLVKRTNVLSMVVSFEQGADGNLYPLPADDDRSVRAIDQGIQHYPKRWQDGGVSFEPELTGDSLDHERVKALAVLAGTVASAPLVAIGSMYH